MSQMVRLVAMSREETDEYLEEDVGVLARENVEAGFWGRAEALRRARQSQKSILPEGAETKGHHFFHVLDRATENKVGMAWLHENLASDPPTGFIFDIQIDETLRRQGYGEATMRAIETLASRMGLASLGLHVFAHNTHARRLYRKLGYTTRSLNMIKVLPRP